MMGFGKGSSHRRGKEAGSQTLKEAKDMTQTEAVATQAAESAWAVHRENLRFIRDNMASLEKDFPGRFVLVAGGKVEGNFATRAEARDFRDTELPEEVRPGAVIWPVDTPGQAYQI